MIGDDNEQFQAFRKVLHGIAPLPEGEFEYLRHHAEHRIYRSGQIVLEVGQTPNHCWFVTSGFLRFFYLTESGREYNKAFSRPGEIVMPLSAVLGRTTSTYVIAAVTDVETLAFPTAIIPALYGRHRAWERVGRVLAEQMALRKEARERELLLDSALVRFQRFADRYPELVDWIPQRQIASYIGVTEQALSRLLREWRINKG